MRASDVKGYYATLGVAPTASSDAIKATYRRRAMELHPDRNPGRDTTGPFQALNEAYEVLSHPVSRARYDTLGAQPAATRRAKAATAPPEPILCSRCGKVSAQPRVVVFKTVKSFVLVTLRKPMVGVFCSPCARKQSIKASAITWLLGWWGFPWGPAYTAHALLSNLFGGTHPPLENSRMLAYQAYYFYATGRPQIAHAVAQSALGYCKKIPKKAGRHTPGTSERDDLINRLHSFLDGLGSANAAPLKSAWGVFHGGFFVQLALMAAAGIPLAVKVTHLARHAF